MTPDRPPGPATLDKYAALRAKVYNAIERGWAWERIDPMQVAELLKDRDEQKARILAALPEALDEVDPRAYESPEQYTAALAAAIEKVLA